MKRYEKLSSQIKQRIENGYYDVNQKLPSIRDMSRQQSLSISTVQAAYRSLEDSGLVKTKLKSGYYVLPLKSHALPDISRPEQRPVKVSNWNEVLTFSADKKHTRFTHLGRGYPDTSLNTLKPLQLSHAKIARQQPEHLFGNTPNNGMEALRKQIAFVMMDSGCQLHPDDILITTGCQEAISLSLKALTQPGDIVAIDSPSFYGATQVIESNGLKVIEIPTHPETGISLAALELALEQWPIKVIQLIPSSNNPLGYLMPDENKQKLLALAAQYDLAIIEDDICGDLVYQNPRTLSIKSFDTQGRVLMCSSFSKTVAPGLRIGWVAAGRYRDIVTHLKYVTSLASSTLPQLALAEFIEQGDYKKHIHNAKRNYQHNRDSMINWIRLYFPEETKVSLPQGGFNLWVELSKKVDTSALNESLKAHRISIAPGVLFSATGKYKNCFRLNYSTAPTPTVKHALKIIGEQIKLVL